MFIKSEYLSKDSILLLVQFVVIIFLSSNEKILLSKGKFQHVKDIKLGYISWFDKKNTKNKNFIGFRKGHL